MVSMQNISWNGWVAKRVAPRTFQNESSGSLPPPISMPVGACNYAFLSAMFQVLRLHLLIARCWRHGRRHRRKVALRILSFSLTENYPLLITRTIQFWVVFCIHHVFKMFTFSTIWLMPEHYQCLLLVTKLLTIVGLDPSCCLWAGAGA